MSLFVDGNISQVQDLTEFESSLTDVASTEGIDLSAKLTVAKLELGLTLQRFILENQNESTFGFAFSATYGLDNVVVTDSLKQWHTLQAIAVTYRDAFNQQLNDRYKGKWAEFADLAANASRVAFEVGIGISFHPVPKPGPPILTQTVGTQLASTWYVATSFTTQQGVEGSVSDAAVISTGDGSSVRVNLTKPAVNATGWNVYVGQSNDQIYKQNDIPLQLTGEWVLPNSNVRTESRPGDGQKADTYLRKRNLLRRG